MDPVGTLVQGAQALTATKYLIISAVALTLYDYILTFNNEVRYVWRGCKSWIFYLYITNRVLLLVDKSWEIYYTSSPRKSKTVCLAAYYGKVLIVVLFLLSSDIFITLRIYAITFRNKILAAYFGSLAFARFAMSLASSFSKPPTVIDLPRIPVDAFNLCGHLPELKFKLVPNSIGTAFELSAFVVIVWCTYRNKRTLKFSALVRTIVTEATIYFLVMVAAQTYIQLSMVLMKGIDQQLSFLAYGLFNPILTMRFTVSLKRSADPGGGEEWQLKHFSSVNFASGTSPDSQVPTVCEDIEMNPVNPPNHRREL